MTTPSAEAVIRLVDASRRFGAFQALSHLDLEVMPGQMIGVVGPSGAGKTTAVRLMTGELRPSEGSVSVLGHDPTDMPSRTRQAIGFMPQHFALYDDLTTAENIDFVASLFGLLLFRRRRRTRYVLELLGLWEVRNRRAGKLSGGMQRRLQLATALVHDPALIFLDEPTAGIDPLLREAIWTELTRLRDLGRTILVTTQYVTEAERCDVVALIAGGRLLAFAPPDELRRQAFGGQVLDVTTARPFDIQDLAIRPPIEHVRQVGPRTFHAVTADAAVATPTLIEAVESAGGSVVSIAEHRSSFDEVFAELIQQAGMHPDGAVA
jgi:ABC-2 type transport system ATP-binding protein